MTWLPPKTHYANELVPSGSIVGYRELLASSSAVMVHHHQQRFGLKPPQEENTWDFKALSYDSRKKHKRTKR